MKPDHAAALEWAVQIQEKIDAALFDKNLAAAYLELRELAKVVVEPSPYSDHRELQALRAAIGEE